MTNKQIVELVRNKFHCVTIDKDGVYFQQDFDSSEEYEPHDVAWDLLYEFNEELAEDGLTIKNSGSDNDTLWGYIVTI